MKKEKTELTDLFRSRLADAKMPVREGFWEELQAELPQGPVVTKGKRALHFRRWPLRPMAAAASVLLLLGGASAAFWWLMPQQTEEQPVATLIASGTPAAIRHDGVEREEFSTQSEVVKPVRRRPALSASAPQVTDSWEEEEERGVVSVRLSITVSQLSSENPWGNRNSLPSRYVLSAKDVWQVADQCVSAVSVPATPQAEKSAKWALKASIGTSLPKGTSRMPLQMRLSAERSLNDRFSLEAGLQYNRLSEKGGPTLHTLALPMKLHLRLTPEADTELYASLGGAIEKCIAGAEDNGFHAEPLQLSALAGVGVRYRLNDRLALFAEPELAHHFSTRSHTHTLYKERPTNLSLLCGVRMMY